MKSLMNRYVKLLSFLPGICLIAACAGHQIKGYEINGSAPLPEFEGKMVYMKDASSGQPIDSAEIIHGKFAFADTVTIVSPVVKVLSIRASKSGLEYRLPVVIENGSIQADISDMVCTGGTMLNERMQDFLMAVDEDWPALVSTERSNFSSNNAACVLAVSLRVTFSRYFDGLTRA